MFISKVAISLYDQFRPLTDDASSFSVLSRQCNVCANKLLYGLCSINMLVSGKH